MKAKLLLAISAIFFVLVSCETTAPLYQSSIYVWDCSVLTTDNGIAKAYTGTDSKYEVKFTEDKITVTITPQGASFATDGQFDTANTTTIEYTIDKESNLNPFTTNTAKSRVYAPAITSTKTSVAAGSSTTTHKKDTRSATFTYDYDKSYGFVLTTSLAVGITLYPKK